MLKSIYLITSVLLVQNSVAVTAASIDGSSHPTNEVTLGHFLHLDCLRVALTQPGWAILTATRDALGPFYSWANIFANNRLRKNLWSLSIPYLEVSGYYKGESDGVSFVILAPESQAHELGLKYNQESILTTVGLVYHDSSITPADHSRNLFPPEAEKAAFYTTVRERLSFSVHLMFEDTAALQS